MVDLRAPKLSSRSLASAILLALVVTANAADSSRGAPLPGLTTDEGSEVSALSCSVTLSGQEATVEMELGNSADQPALLLSGPIFGWLGESEAYPDRHFPELEIRIDGKVLTPGDRFEAFMGKRDISVLVREAGIDPWAIGRTPPIVLAQGDTWAVKVLERSRALRRSGDDYLAQWSARRLLRIALKAAPKQTLQLKYLARPAFMQLSSVQLVTSEREREYCISPKQINARLHTVSRPRPVNIVEFSIATGIDGHPAPSVTLSTVTQGAPTARVFAFACGPHGTPIATRGNLTRRPIQVDPAGNLHLLQVADPQT